MSWRERAACVNPNFDPEWWHPTSTTDLDITKFALNVCNELCPVKALCDEKYDGGYGIWGGRVKKIWVE